MYIPAARCGAHCGGRRRSGRRGCAPALSPALPCWHGGDQDPYAATFRGCEGDLLLCAVSALGCVLGCVGGLILGPAAARRCVPAVFRCFLPAAVPPSAPSQSPAPSSQSPASSSQSSAVCRRHRAALTVAWHRHPGCGDAEPPCCWPASRQRHSSEARRLILLCLRHQLAWSCCHAAAFCPTISSGACA